MANIRGALSKWDISGSEKQLSYTSFTVFTVFIEQDIVVDIGQVVFPNNILTYIQRLNCEYFLE